MGVLEKSELDQIIGGSLGARSWKSSNVENSVILNGVISNILT